MGKIRVTSNFTLFIRTLKSELVKLFFTRTFRVYSSVGFFLNAFVEYGFFKEYSSKTKSIPNSQDVVRLFLGSTQVIALVASLVGAILITSEFSTGSLPNSVICAGGVKRLFKVKGLIGLLVGAVLSVISILIGIFTSLLWSTKTGHQVHWNHSIFFVIVGGFISVSLAGAWGIAIGTLVKKTTPAVIGISVWTTTIETVIAAQSNWLDQWLPTGAQSAIVFGKEQSIIGVNPQSIVLGRFSATLVFIGWIFLANVISLRMIRRKGFAA